MHLNDHYDLHTMISMSCLAYYMIKKKEEMQSLFGTLGFFCLAACAGP